MMRCCQLLVVLAAGAALAGCPDAHVLTTDAALDATAADAAAPDAPDAPTVDAPVCLDADGDGAAAASCGHRLRRHGPFRRAGRGRVPDARDAGGLHGG